MKLGSRGNSIIVSKYFPLENIWMKILVKLSEQENLSWGKGPMANGQIEILRPKKKNNDRDVDGQRLLSSSSSHCIQYNSLSYLISDRSFVLTPLFVQGIFSGKKVPARWEKGTPPLARGLPMTFSVTELGVHFNIIICLAFFFSFFLSMSQIKMMVNTRQCKGEKQRGRSKRCGISFQVFIYFYYNKYRLLDNSGSLKR